MMDFNNTLNGTEQTGEDVLVLEGMSTMDDLAKRMFNHKLTALRAQHPFLAIMPMPNSGFAVKLAANTPVEIWLPPEVKFVFPSGDQVYYLSRNGTAVIPPAPDNINNGNYTQAAFQNPEGCLLYVEEVQSLSVISPVVCNFTMGFYSSL